MTIKKPDWNEFALTVTSVGIGWILLSILRMVLS